MNEWHTCLALPSSGDKHGSDCLQPNLSNLTSRQDFFTVRELAEAIRVHQNGQHLATRGFSSYNYGSSRPKDQEILRDSIFRFAFLRHSRKASTLQWLEVEDAGLVEALSSLIRLFRQ